MAENKSHARDGVSLAGVSTGHNSNFNIANTNNITEISRRDQQKAAQGLTIILIILVVFVCIVLSRLFHRDPGVEKWMDVSTTLRTSVPDAKAGYDKSTNEIQYLSKELETTRRKLALKADVFNAISSEDQSLITDLQHHLNIARDNQKHQYDYTVQFLTSSLQSRNLIAKGYDRRRQEWECPSYEYWEHLKLSGDLTDTSMSITGGLSGQVHLVQVQFGKPLGSGPDQLCQVSNGGTLGQ
jgi:hypothetical protein